MPDDVSCLHSYATSLSGLAGLLFETDPRSALPYYQRALEIDRKVYARSADVLYGRAIALGLENLASVFDDLAEYPHAVQYASESLQRFQELVRLDPRNVTLRASLAIAYANAADYLSKPGGRSTALQYVNRSQEITRAQSSADPKNAYYRRKVA